MKKKIKLNLGCASRPLKGYINVDQDNIKKIKRRYPNLKKIKNLKIYNYNIFKLPFKNSTIDEIRADGLIEHLSFAEEKKFFLEMSRSIKKNGLLRLSTPDFEKAVRQWIRAKDDWKDFHRNDDDAIKKSFWFGTYSYKQNNRWGYLAATFYGSQHGKGQYHKNCYSKKKLKAICVRLGFRIIELKNFRWKKNRDHMINLIAKKI